jgi:hypothetical protein
MTKADHFLVLQHGRQDGQNSEAALRGGQREA